MRIAIGGFQHETNTFAPSKATYEHFAREGGWPGLRRGGEILDTMVARNLPIAGFIEQMKGSRHQLLPTAWAAAEPSAHVTQDAYERIAAMIVNGVREAQPDAVYLDLHGAMVAEHLDDGEGELLARVRALVGPDRLIVASLDLHANVTQRMLECADLMVAYRTYPHVDMAETGARAAFVLAQRLAITAASGQLAALARAAARCWACGRCGLCLATRRRTQGPRGLTGMSLCAPVVRAAPCVELLYISLTSRHDCAAPVSTPRSENPTISKTC